MLGNHIEDKIGQDLVQSSRLGERSYITNTQDSFIPPSDRPDPPNMPVNMPTTQELKAKNKDGMPYSLLFDHGLKPMSKEERFTSTAMYTMMGNTDGTKSSTDNSLTREKAKQMQQDLRLSYTMTSQARLANAHNTFVPGAPLKPFAGNTCELPNWKRQGLLTRTIPDYR